MSFRRGMVVLAGNSHPELAEAVVRHLDVRLGSCLVYHRSNRETMVEIHESVRGKNVYIIQTGTKEVNDDIMELLIMCNACKGASANSVIGVIPYMPYSQQTKMRRRGNISMKLFAQMLVKSGFDHIITVDLHSKESLGFFDCGIDNIRASPFLLQYIQEAIPDYHNAVIVAKNPLAAKRASSYAERLRLAIAVIHGEVKECDDEEMNDGRASPPIYDEPKEVTTPRSSGSSKHQRSGAMSDRTPNSPESTPTPELIFASSKTSSSSESCDADNQKPVLIVPSTSSTECQDDHKRSKDKERHGRRRGASLSSFATLKDNDLRSNIPQQGSLSVSIGARTMHLGMSSMPPLTPKERPPLNVVGNIRGKIVIMVDNLINDVHTCVHAAQIMKERGAKRIYALATHGLLSREAPQLIQESPIDEVVVTNTVPHNAQKMQCDKIKTVDIAILLAEAIRRIHNKESMSHLFRYVTLED